MIIDIFKNKTLYEQLEQYNSKIEDYCKSYNYVKEGENYDFDHDKISKWFNPDCIKDIYLPRTYPHTCSITHKNHFNLLLYACNYFPLFMINTLYGDNNKDILIEDCACGMAKLTFYLNKLGFNNFSLIDNFSQLPEAMLRGFMQSEGINYKLNNNESKPTVFTQVALPEIIKDNFYPDTELICFYNNEGSIKVLEETHLNNYIFLCEDEDFLGRAYCRKDKYDKFKSKIEQYKVKYKELGTYFIPQYEPSFDDKESKALAKYMESGNWLTEFKETEKFENMLKDFIGSKHAFMVNNGTISLSLALLASGVKAGDNVLVPSLSMIATANAVRFIGANPIFVDIRDNCLNMSVTEALKILNHVDIKAVIYVTFNGRWGNNEIWKLIDYCKNKNIKFIEDSAQGLGSFSYEGHHVGERADIMSISFSMPKIITCGQGGCLLTNNDELALNIKRLKDFGRENGGNDVHDYFGINSKITDLQAVVGIEQFKKLRYRILRKKEIYRLYSNSLKGVGDIKFIPTDLNYTTPWFVDIFTEKRNKLQVFLSGKNIGTRIVYPPMYSQKIYEGSTGKLPVTEEYSHKGLWLPCSFSLRDDEILWICDKIKEFYE